MKKYLSYSITAIFTLLTVLSTRCTKVLDQPNLSAYDSAAIWSDSNLVNSYLANLYTLFGNWNVSLDRLDDQVSGIGFPVDAITVTDAGPLATWSYSTIRLINEGIAQVKAGNTSEGFKNRALGQLYFLRAYKYFPMVTTYGGVPYVKIAQDRYKDSLNVPRNSTKECFDFIISDIDSAIALLPQHILSSSTTDWGRIDGNFALAFKAKVLLYMASPQFNPARPWDNAYWQQAYSVNKEAYESLKNQGYALVEDYSQIALQEKNAEIVFSVTNQYPNKIANWDYGARPGSLSRGTASVTPTWEMVKNFPMLDGKASDDPSGKYYKPAAAFMQSFWENRDPRFDKSVVWNGKLFPVAGTPSTYRQYTGVGIADPLDAFGVNPNAGVTSANNNKYSGFFILKNCDLNLTQAQVQGNYAVDFVVMRFAEVMLNYAEAANETGHSEEALEILKAIRQRAGIEAGADGNYGITAGTRLQYRQAIMDERNVEFCFEGMRFNDLRRWRRFDLLDNVPKHGLEAIAKKADGGEMPIEQAQALASDYSLEPDDFSYSALQIPISGVRINTVPDKYYFAPLQSSVIAAGDRLEQNKGWGGNFDPTIH